MLFRLILVLVIGGSLGLFAFQNLTPAIPLVFLGFQLPTLPLSFWVLGAIAAGALTSLIIRLLFGLATLGSEPSVQSRSQSTARRTEGRDRGTGSTSRYESAARAAARSTFEKDDDSTWQDWRGYEPTADRPPTPSTPPRSPSTSAKTSSANSADDWEQPFDEDWENSTTQDRPRSPANQEARPNPDTAQSFEVERSPTQKSQSGSVYSYSYQNPHDTGVGQAEKVVDADYRVLVPPYRPLDADSPEPPLDPSAFEPPAPAPKADEDGENADDWFEDRSDDFEDSPPRR